MKGSLSISHLNSIQHGDLCKKTFVKIILQQAWTIFLKQKLALGVSKVGASSKNMGPKTSPTFWEWLAPMGLTHCEAQGKVDHHVQKR